MEVALPGNSNSGTPFQREVREWQRIDPNTGALLTGRLEADRWIRGPQNTYGKVVDSQNVSQPNGTQHTQRKQLEVLQARTSSGSMQVIRSQTVQTTSSRMFSSSASSRLVNRLTNGSGNDSDDSDTDFRNRLINTAPSLKLSNLMKSSNNVTSTKLNLHLEPIVSMPSSSSSLSSSSSAITTKNVEKSSSLYTQPTDFNNKVVGGSSVDDDNHYDDNESCIDRFRHSMGENSSLFKNRHSSPLQRGRSISTDDLTKSDLCNDSNNDSDCEPCEWRRVSKIRRSFQFPKTSSTKVSPIRPLDLPENSVSVAKIRQELENGRRLTTAMRNNNVDLDALDNLLNTCSPKPAPKKASFLTAESLKEIRGKLKKLSDESLYKDDFFNHDPDPEALVEPPPPPNKEDFQFSPKVPIVASHTTNSLGTRHTKNRDINSTEWHLRRKSYGFEKMSPPDENTMHRTETSTDSGIGRSGELGNWSPTESSPPRGTVITFGEPSKQMSVEKPVQRRFVIGKLIPKSHSQGLSSTEEIEMKRHSIAVDESKYVSDVKKTSIHLNGFATSSNVISDESTRRHKRVEFCKTEVHFAAESGRVNIVETELKPPPTNNFRRRRRGPSSTINSSVSDMQMIRFGDLQRKISSSSESDEKDISTSNVTVTIPIDHQHNVSPSGEDIDETAIRGILKNKPVKPRPYHLGENIESPNALWSAVGKSSALHTSTEHSITSSMEKDETDKVSKSVAERVKIVEERKEGSGYSTKIKLSLSDPPYNWNQNDVNSSEESSEPLKIKKEIRGARQLRDHELSYFGVQAKSTTKSSKYPSLKQETQRPNCKPDLLCHEPPSTILQPIAVSRRTIKTADIIAEHEGPLYENINNEYTRKNDLARDEMILDEMNKSAEQTLKAVKDESQRRMERRKSSTSSHVSSKPLATINEKTSRTSSSETKSSIQSHGSHRSSRSNSVDRAIDDAINDYVNVRSVAKVKTKVRPSIQRNNSNSNSSTEDLSQKIEIVRKIKRSNNSTSSERSHHRSLRSNPAKPNETTKLSSNHETSGSSAPERRKSSLKRSTKVSSERSDRHRSKDAPAKVSTKKDTKTLGDSASKPKVSSSSRPTATSSASKAAPVSTHTSSTRRNSNSDTMMKQRSTPTKSVTTSVSASPTKTRSSKRF